VTVAVVMLFTVRISCRTSDSSRGVRPASRPGLKPRLGRSTSAVRRRSRSLDQLSFPERSDPTRVPPYRSDSAAETYRGVLTRSLRAVRSRLGR